MAALGLLVARILGGVATVMGHVAVPWRPHLGPVALLPEAAAADMLNNRGTNRDSQALHKQRWPRGVLVANRSLLSSLFSRRLPLENLV